MPAARKESIKVVVKKITAKPKKSPLKKKPTMKAATAHQKACEPVEMIAVVEQRSVWHMPVPLEHSIVAIASFTMIFGSIMLVSFKSNAQMGANVSATVAATPFNTPRAVQKTWWTTMDPYQQLTVASGSAVAVLLGGVGALYAAQHKRHSA